MGNEFNLSEKIETFNTRKNCGVAWKHFIYKKDVREFIKKLKEEFIAGDEYDINDIEEAIDKLIGDKLK